MNAKMHAKQLLRKKILEKTVNSFSEFANQKIIDKAINVIDAYQPKIVGIYHPLGKEPNLLPLLTAFQGSVIFALPRLLSPSNMVFLEYHLTDPLIESKFFKVLEPETKASNIDRQTVVPKMIFVPGLAFSIDGYRLGKGAGNYDRYLNKNNILAIGSTFHDYLTLNIPIQYHDQKLDVIITDQLMIKYV